MSYWFKQLKASTFAFWIILAKTQCGDKTAGTETSSMENFYQSRHSYFCPVNDDLWLQYM